MKKVILNGLALLMMGSCLQAMKSDKDKLGKELIENIKWARGDMVEELIARGADVNYQDQDGFTPLQAAVDFISHDVLYGEEKLESIQMLLNAGANVNLPNSQGQTPLMIAVYENLPITVKAVIRARADLNLQDNDGETALIKAVKRRREDIIKDLLSVGVSASKIDKKGNSALIYAASWMDPEFLKKLIKLMCEPTQEQIEQARKRSIALLLKLRESKSVQKGVDQKIARDLFEANLQEARAQNEELIIQQILRIENERTQGTLLRYLSEITKP